ncbi:hypothetical protein OK344_12100 [Kaistella sp. BT6-1-3]|uniref:Uncharacterized protein n=1 Tax=Kaistella yananensis TaxID=2989820 RepID=A0ABT3JR52_9FLAO|nr:hypothetical protein [Kaistella yananensis]MCW4452945.1 hypothetical protein [Kaistella yananensis]
MKIYKFFYNEALKKGNAAVLKEKYISFFKQDSEYEDKGSLYNNLSMATAFISVVTPFKQIKENFKALLPKEIELKEEIKKLMVDETLSSEIPAQTTENFENYLSKEWEYFNGEAYSNDNLQILFAAMNDYYYLISRKYFLTKVDLLSYQMAQLEPTEKLQFSSCLTP